ncbi:hypothetical protein NQ315_011236 [Exocentrus adspersus]|uniref:RWD domain-containing protein n=1 Tax=Exocentrus adspersus TaxID=1586481 RepID=A0AAV8V5P5_9CUCU|nr:hypothetical protein NQ315_011236 [Exocentrus adspersus]
METFQAKKDVVRRRRPYKSLKLLSVTESDKLPLEKIRENLQTQLSELESLQSVFYNPGEIRVEDMCTLSDIKNFVNGHSTYLPQYLDLTVNLLIENLKFELCVTLSHEYPYSSPEIFVRNHKLNRSQHVKLNKDLCDHVAGLERGEPCIFNAVSWLQDNAQGYVEVEEEPASLQDEKNDRYIRYWIYSHHIYSKTKRREIVDLANLLHINGFCMPVTEEDSDRIEKSFLKFNTFEEVVFQSSGVKCNHMDMGELYKYLEEHKVSHIFKEIFGVDAKSSS